MRSVAGARPNPPTFHVLPCFPIAGPVEKVARTGCSLTPDPPTLAGAGCVLSTTSTPTVSHGLTTSTPTMSPAGGGRRPEDAPGHFQRPGSGGEIRGGHEAGAQWAPAGGVVHGGLLVNEPCDHDPTRWFKNGSGT